MIGVGTKDKINNIKGITLISLVVTIIVLLILAGITISVLLGDNGIVNKAIISVRESKIGNLKEQITLYLYELKADGREINPEDIYNKMKDGGYLDDNAVLEGIWISTFETKVSVLNPNDKAVMIDGENSGYVYWYNAEKNYVIVNGYTGDISENMVMPDYIDGHIVGELIGSVYHDNTIVRTINLPDTINLISGYTFWANQNLATINFPFLLQQIGDNAFGTNVSLKNIEIPKSVKILGEGAFVNCSIENLVLNEGLQKIGKWAFAGSITAKSNLKIPSTVIEIGEEAFLNYGKDYNVKIYKTSTGILIGNNAFYGTNLINYDLMSTNDVKMLSDAGIAKINNIYNLSGKYVFFTFDDGPSYDLMTENILDILKKENVPATFFMIGSIASGKQNVVKRACLEGHYIANHGYSNSDETIYSSANTVVNEYYQTEDVLKQAIGNSNYSSRLFRFPGSSQGTYLEVKNAAKTLLDNQNIGHIDWNVDINDASLKEDGSRYTVDEMYQRLISTSEGHDVIVVIMHNYSTLTNSDKVLEKAISYYRNKGYEFKNFYDLENLN